MKTQPGTHTGQCILSLLHMKFGKSCRATMWPGHGEKWHLGFSVCNAPHSTFSGEWLRAELAGCRRGCDQPCAGSSELSVLCKYCNTVLLHSRKVRPAATQALNLVLKGKEVGIFSMRSAIHILQFNFSVKMNSPAHTLYKSSILGAYCALVFY